MPHIQFLYRDKHGRVSATSEADYTDESRAVAAARLQLRERDYDRVDVWAGPRLAARLRRTDVTGVEAQ